MQKSINSVTGDILLTSIKQDIWAVQDCHVNCKPKHVHAYMYVQILRTYLRFSSPPGTAHIVPLQDHASTSFKLIIYFHPVIRSYIVSLIYSIIK